MNITTQFPVSFSLYVTVFPEDGIAEIVIDDVCRRSTDGWTIASSD